MSAGDIARLFATDAHNPSFAAVRELVSATRAPVDFCVPVNRHFPPASLLDEIREALPDIVKHYPDYAIAHQRALSDFTSLPADNLIVANGSTELITLLCEGARGPFATDVPTFGRWTDLPLRHGLPTRFLRRRRERAFALDVGQIVTYARANAIRTLVLSNPNNPTGAALAASDVAALVHELAELELIVVDESFIDFASVGSVAELATRTPNLVVVKSLGKSLGWHGVRLGYAVAEADRAERLRARVPYWNVNGLAAFVLARLGAMRGAFERSLERVRADRDALSAGLSAIERLDAYPSQANFVFAALPDATDGRALRDALLIEHGLLIRECGNKLGASERYLRLAVNRASENDLLVAALRERLDR